MADKAIRLVEDDDVIRHVMAMLLQGEGVPGPDRSGRSRGVGRY